MPAIAPLLTQGSEPLVGSLLTDPAPIGLGGLNLFLGLATGPYDPALDSEAKAEP